MEQRLVGVAAGLAAGFGIGALYFGVLWLRVARHDRIGRWTGWFAVAGLLRLGVAVALFGLALIGGWVWLVAALGGFLVALVVVTRRIGRADRPPNRREQ